MAKHPGRDSEAILKQPPRNVFNTSWVFGLLLAFLLGCGIFLRYSDLSAPLLDFHPTRQLFGAIKARGIYYQSLPDAPAWQKDLAVRQYAGEATIEPPLMEHLAAVLYQSFGEQTALPRAVSASFWLLGGLFLFLLSKNLTGSAPAAAFGLAFYLLLPYGVTASRAFQPDPLMILLVLIFWWSMENWGRHLSWNWAIIAGISGGLAVFVKFPAAFFIIGAALGIILAHVGLSKSLKLSQTWLIVLIGILPPGAYLYYGTFMNGFLGQQFGGRFYPEMWFNPFFYLRWFLKLDIVASVPWLALALLGCLVFSSKPVKIFLASLWVAYFIFGMTFAHHISSHDYYSLPIIPIAALCLSQLALGAKPLFEEIPLPGQDADKPRFSGSKNIIILIILLSSMLLISVDQYLKQRANDYRPQAGYWTQVGSAIGHQPGVLALTTDYGYPLAYYGWQNSTPWPAAVDIQDFNETFDRMAAKKDYFLVTDFDEYDRQPELQKRLNGNYPLLIQNRTFIVFDLAHPKK